MPATYPPQERPTPATHPVGAGHARDPPPQERPTPATHPVGTAHARDPHRTRPDRFTREQPLPSRIAELYSRPSPPR
jgi:hypothetical protein